MYRTSLKSDYCTSKAAEAFEDLIQNTNARYILLSYVKDELGQLIIQLREHRTELQNQQIRREYKDVQQIERAITVLSNTLNRNFRGANRPSVELEK
jgi:hypothetical protein